MPTKVIYSKKLTPKGKTSRSAKPKRAAPKKKIVIDVDGRRRTLQTLDVHSRNFGRDFEEAFKKSVKKARRENTRIIGRPDLVVGK